MKICFLCNEYPPVRHGGIGVFTRVMARTLARAGHQVRVLGALLPGSAEPGYEEDQGVRVWRLAQPRWRMGWLVARWALARAACRWARRGEIDLLEAPDYEGWVAGWPSMPAPVVIRMHGSLGYFASEMGRSAAGPMFWVERAALDRADALCSVSRYAAERTRSLFRLGGGTVAVLHNPVELPARPPVWIRPGSDVVFSGTLTEKKGIASLARAWPLVLAQRPEAMLHVFGKDGRAAGGGSMRESIERQLGKAAARVRFYGHVTGERLFEALQTARAAVFPSFAEAFAIAPLEAMAHGCVTICSRRGSGPEMIRDEVDGLLVDPARPREIARAIVRVLASPELAARLGEGGWTRVRQEFSCDVQLRRNEEYYAGCLERFHSK